jgi:hypothetical protein
MKNDIGHYRVKDQLFDNKYDAVMYAQRTNNDVSWHFFDEVFDKVNWYEEPDLSLTELYRIRAQQIRDKYDYLVVFCSGGADSNNVIRTFLDNNIHVDEVMGIAPMDGLSNWEFDKNNLSEDNTISETKYAMFPLFNEIAARNPNIKLTINDYFKDVINKKDEQWTYEACGNIVTVLTSHFTDISRFKHIDELIQKGKRIGLVYGTDKPVIRVDSNNDLYFIFADAGINYLNMPDSRNYHNVDRVLFYWTPDLPELLVKQAHVVARAINLPENQHIIDSLRPRPKSIALSTFQDYIDQYMNQDSDPITKDDILERFIPTNQFSNRLLKFSNKSIYQRMIVPFIYPTTYTKDLFQCQKVDSDAGFFTKDQAWVHVLHKDTRVSDMVLSGVKQLYNSLSPRFLNINGTGFTNYIKIYKYGNMSKFSMRPLA